MENWYRSVSRDKAWIRVLILCPFLVGCGGDSVVRVAGTVSVNGTPVQQGTIRFLPADGRGPSAEAVIQEGRYRLELPPGNKKVAIMGFKIVGELFPWGPDAPSSPQLEPVVPPQFNSRTTLTVDLQSDDEAIDFDLQVE